MKSGTSLLRKLLSRHSHLHGGLETFWFSPDLQERWRDPDTKRAQWLRGFYDLTRDEYVGMIVSAGSGTELFDRVMARCANREQKSRWVEKTPDNVLHLGLIEASWPRAQFLHVIRDPRDVWASWKKNQKSSLDDFIAQAHKVRDSLGSRAGSRDAAYMEVTYERLVGETRATLEEVLSFIGEPWEDGLDTYAGDDSDHQRVLEVTGKDSATTRSLARPIFQSSVGQWGEVLEPAEVARIERELAEVMTRWGYA